jgi:Fe-S cluster biogenesis protein NfuA
MAKRKAPDLETRVEKTLDEIRPYLMSHGGDVNLLEVTPEKVARLQLVGACGGCPMSVMTLRFGMSALGGLHPGAGRHQAVMRRLRLPV